MVSVCFIQGASVPHTDSKLQFLTWSGDAAALCLRERLEGKRLFMV